MKLHCVTDWDWSALYIELNVLFQNFVKFRLIISDLLGCQDGSVVVREWHHSAVVARPRPGGTFAKVARVRFNQQGNKFGVIDGDGNLSLYQLGLASQVNKPYYVSILLSLKWQMVVCQSMMKIPRTIMSDWSPSS